MSWTRSEAELVGTNEAEVEVVSSSEALEPPPSLRKRSRKRANNLEEVTLNELRMVEDGVDFSIPEDPPRRAPQRPKLMILHTLSQNRRTFPSPLHLWSTYRPNSNGRWRHASQPLAFPLCLISASHILGSLQLAAYGKTAIKTEVDLLALPAWTCQGSRRVFSPTNPSGLATQPRCTTGGKRTLVPPTEAPQKNRLTKILFRWPY